MTREEVERRLKEKACEIIKILREYNPDSNYFALNVSIKNNWVNCNNRNWPGGDDEDKPIDFCGPIFEEDK